MPVKFPPGLAAYMRIVITMVRQSSTHRDLTDRANGLYRAVADLERRVADHTRAIEQVLADAHGWMTLPKDRWPVWLADWSTKGKETVADAETYFAEYRSFETEVLKQARDLTSEYHRLQQQQRKSVWQRACEGVMRPGFDFLEFPDMLVGKLRTRNRQLQEAVAKLKPGL